jgi:hypothetical protein
MYVSEEHAASIFLAKKSQDSIITIIMIIIQLFVHLHAELNSQMPITESVQIQRNNNRADTREKKTRGKNEQHKSNSIYLLKYLKAAAKHL